MKKLLSAIAILSFFVFPVTLHSQTLDQSQLNYNAGTSARNLPGYSHFQTFTAGLTGTLVQIDMGVFNFINGVGTLIIYEGGDTTGIILQTTTVNVNCPAGNCFATFVVSAPVVAGQIYCFRFIPGAGIPDPYGVQMEVPGTYAGGEFAIIDPSGVYFTGFDQVFRTFVLTSTGLMNIESNEMNMTISPNPFSETTTIYFSGKFSFAEINLVTAQGKTVKSFRNFSGDKIFIDGEHLQPGLYFIHAITKSQYVICKKMMVLSN